MSARSSKKAQVPNFRQATARLEEIVARLDSPDTELEEMITLAEEGMQLIRSSRKILAEAELKIQQLEHPDTPVSETDDDADHGGFTLI